MAAISCAGPVKLTENEYRRRMNYEIAQEIKEDIVRKIKQQRARWLGHVWRAGEETVAYSILDWNPGSARRRGRPRSTWWQEVKDDLKRIGMWNWQEKTKDRRAWQDMCHKI
ncbi:uncharacterized protein LOC130441767 [Diorhabda sublineata]|uniref:uncharacterized protein LOC130441767 n=1 Tax=Diorhabda sublineata TaxID=1163346 RepID=UPI0024E04C10|nr:uncharacterized protein LOC130441767 [Diorhabda sublineata]